MRPRAVAKSIALSFFRRLEKIAVGRPRWSGFYWWLRGDFDREHAAVLYGQMLHSGSVEEKVAAERENGPRYTLRRNIHRLEKGLIMRPRRTVFAADYIGETVDAFDTFCQRLDKKIEGDALLAGWSGDVLRRYFEAIDFTTAKDEQTKQRLEALDSRFRKLESDIAAPDSAKAPYARDLSPLNISYDDVLKLAQRRRSVRWYEQRPVDRTLIDQAVTVAGYSPSACNRQPFRFELFDDPGRVREIGGVAMGTRGFSDNFPGLAVLVGRLRAYFDPRDRHVIYIDASLAAMAFQFALEVQGVGSCCINWPDVRDREQKIGQLLGLAPDERVIMLISFGYPDPTGLVPYSQKKSLDELRRYNTNPKLAAPAAT
jgi:nitroreductase